MKIANFVSAGNPWFYRGGNRNNTASAGVFATTNSNGNANSNDSFRIVLSGVTMIRRIFLILRFCQNKIKMVILEILFRLETINILL